MKGSEVVSKRKYNISHIEENMLKYGVAIESPVVIDGKVTNYIVTTNGEVYSTSGGKRRRLKPSIDEAGYYIVGLRIDGKRISLGVHRLVASTFIKNPKNKEEVNHKNGDKSKNDIFNLEWSTRSENMTHSYETGLHRKGENNVNAVYTETQIRRVCELLEDNIKTRNEIVSETGVSWYTIYNIIKGKKWKHVSKDYDLTKYDVKTVNSGSKPKVTDKTVHTICKMLESKKYTMIQICNKLDVSFNIIADIKRGRTHKNISKLYNF